VKRLIFGLELAYELEIEFAECGIVLERTRIVISSSFSKLYNTVVGF